MKAHTGAARRGLRLFGHYVRFNLRAGMEYRAAFVTQVVGMMLNNTAFIFFWMILFQQVGDLKGYGFAEVMFLWALSAVGYGLAGVFLGNAGYLSRSIYTAELDVYLLQPKPVLANFLLGMLRTRARDLADCPHAHKRYEVVVDVFCRGANAKPS